MNEINDISLKERRLILRLTQQEVADRAGISIQQYQKFEGGMRNIRTASFEVACRVLVALDLDITEFYFGKDSSSERIVINNEPVEAPGDYAFGLSAEEITSRHSKAAIFTWGKEPARRKRQEEIIRNACPDIEIVKVYNATARGWRATYDQMLLDAEAGAFDLVLATNVRKFIISDNPQDVVNVVTALTETGVAIYYVQEGVYYKKEIH